MVREFNGTKHAVNFYREEDTYPSEDGRKLFLKYPGATPYYVIPAGTNLNAYDEKVPVPDMGTPYPITGEMKFTSYDQIPQNCDIVIVSLRYKLAVRALAGDTSRLATVDGKIFQDEAATHPCGCLRLMVG